MLVVHDGLNGFSTLVGGLVVFTGVLTGITAVAAVSVACALVVAPVIKAGPRR